MAESCRVFGCGPEKCRYSIQSGSDYKAKGTPQSADEFLALSTDKQASERAFFVNRAENYAQYGCDRAYSDVNKLATANHPLTIDGVVIDRRLLDHHGFNPDPFAQVDDSDEELQKAIRKAFTIE